MPSKKSRLSDANKIRTPKSGTTLSVNYSYPLKKLEVKFTGGRIYHYRNVEPTVWEELKSTINSGGSSGNFINTRIKQFYEAEEIT